MKFRHKFSRHVVVAWDSHYVSYQHLKASLKAAKRGGHEPSTDFYVRFAQVIEANTKFSDQCRSVLQCDEQQLGKVWNPLLTEYCSNLTLLKLENLQEDLVELLWFYRLNLEALYRIYAKSLPSTQSNIPELEGYLSVLRALIEKYRRTYEKCVSQLRSLQNRIATFSSETPFKLDASNALDQDNNFVGLLLPIMRDDNNRNPFHFAATNGMINLCTHLLSTASSIEEHILLRDHSGFTPLHISVARGHVEITRLLLSSIDKSSVLIPGELLHIALRREDDVMVNLLVSMSIGLRHESCSGESCLYIAAQNGRDDYLRLLLPLLGDEYIDAAESACQWTPLFIGCIEGHTSTVKLLINAGADTNAVDYLGWTAKENAAFRGHLTIVELFSTINAAEGPVVSLQNHNQQRVKAPRFNISSGVPCVIINLGGLQERALSRSSTLDLSGINQHGLRLRISTSDSEAPIERTLPLLEDPVDDSYVFVVKDPTNITIIFDIQDNGTDLDEHRTLIGTGIAYIHTQIACLGSRHGPLLREQCIPILCKNSLRTLGTITFSYFVCCPYYQLECPSSSLTSLEATGSVQLVGHRGLGQNSRESFLQIGENTIESFLAARDQGADYVEFDVQLTKDLVPVLFHDYSLSESGTDVPIHDVTFDQFLHACNIQSPRGHPSSSVLGCYESTKADDDFHPQRPRSRSVTNTHEEGAKHVRDRMKYTIDYLNKGFKPNTRGDFIQDTFATLENVLCNFPQDVGFDMEIKYPRIHEALGAGVAPVSIEINIFVDTILDTIARFGRGRNIILSSFTPEICILLAIKQKAYPVLFITNAGKRPLSDKEKRAGSLQVAVRFAKQWGLAGIVVAADSLVMCPRLIGFIKSQGLVCGTYNPLNNDSVNIELQAKAGIDLLVADRVGLVSKTLKSLDV